MWTPCSERLPDKEGSYLATIQLGETDHRMVTKVVLKVAQNGNKRWCRVGRYDKVIAWMELPKVYWGEE